jgi:hypothetical protein
MLLGKAPPGAVGAGPIPLCRRQDGGLRARPTQARWRTCRFGFGGVQKSKGADTSAVGIGEAENSHSGILARPFVVFRGQIAVQAGRPCERPREPSVGPGQLATTTLATAKAAAALVRPISVGWQSSPACASGFAMRCSSEMCAGVKRRAPM